jgi:methyl-accepting chemotaxis protein
MTMDRTNPPSGTFTGNVNTPRSNEKMEGIARAAHETTDKIAEKAAGVDRLSGTAHRAVDSAADAASSATDWASDVSDQAGTMQARLVESATNEIRARPIATVASALLIGYILGRL